MLNMISRTHPNMFKIGTTADGMGPYQSEHSGPHSKRVDTRASIRGPQGTSATATVEND